MERGVGCPYRIPYTVSMKGVGCPHKLSLYGLYWRGVDNVSKNVFTLSPPQTLPTSPTWIRPGYSHEIVNLRFHGIYIIFMGEGMPVSYSYPLPEKGLRKAGTASLGKRAQYPTP